MYRLFSLGRCITRYGSLRTIPIKIVVAIQLLRNKNSAFFQVILPLQSPYRICVDDFAPFKSKDLVSFKNEGVVYQCPIYEVYLRKEVIRISLR